MVDFKTNTIILNGKIHEITAYEVWWQTPFGLFQERDSAVKAVDEADLDYRFALLPVPVAVAGGGEIYEVIARS